LSPQNSPASILVSQLSKQFDRKLVLNGLDFHAEAGERIVICGPNGSGKTTFLRILATLVSPNQGEIILAGQRLPQQATLARRFLGVVMHQPLLYDELTAIENLRFFGHLYGIPNLQQRCEQTLKLVNLLSNQHNYVRIFSRGMIQRLAIARAILHDPSILLLDEAFTGLDPDATQTFEELLQNITDLGRIVVLTTHNLEHAAQIATRIDILWRGKISLSLSRNQFITQDLSSLYYNITTVKKTPL